MDLAAPHLGFVAAAYGLSLVVLGGLTALALGTATATSAGGSPPRSRRRAEPRSCRGRAMSRAWRCLPLVAFAGLAALFLIALAARSPRNFPSALIGKPAPASSCRHAGSKAPMAMVPGLSMPTSSSAASPWSMSGPPGACPAATSIRCLLNSRRPASGSSASTTRTIPRMRAGFSAALAIPSRQSAPIAKAARPIDWGVYGVPETFVVDAGGRPPQADRPDQPRAARGSGLASDRSRGATAGVFHLGSERPSAFLASPFRPSRNARRYRRGTADISSCRLHGRPAQRL